MTEIIISVTAFLHFYVKMFTISCMKFNKKITKRIVIAIVCMTALLASLLSFGAWWVMRTWVNLTMDELMYQLSASAVGTSMDIIWNAVLTWILPAAAVFLVIVLLLVLVRRKKRIFQIVLVIVLALSVTTLAITKNIVWSTLNVDEYIEYQKNPSTFIEENYVDPSSVSLTFPEEKRNLVFIYLESMEITYADEESGGAFEENVIPELTEIAQTYEDFSGSDTDLNGAYSLPYTTFTMGAMFAMSSGLPLKNNLENNDMVTQSSFFSGITTIGDILEEAGYQNVLMMGSNATFGGRRLFYNEHGSYEIIDYNYAQSTGMIDSDYKVWWGFEDSKLLSFAKDKLEELSESDQPFNLTLLTVDTHFENGYYCSECEDIYDDKYANVMACSSKQIAAFLEWMQEQDWYENTTVVLVGDHPTMDSDFCEDVDEDYQRRAYAAYINSAVEAETDTYRKYSTLDCMPTTLAAMGVQIEGNRLGLGVNLFSDEETLLEEYGISTVTEEIYKKSEFMEELADIDFSSEELKERQSWSLSEDHGTTVYDEDAD